MATTSENLQTIKDSLTAIKQAIIDKGGVINGNITTYANVILNLPTSSEPKENKLTYTSSYVIAEFPVTSTLTVTVFGRKTSDAAASAPYSFDLTIDAGTTTSYPATRSIMRIDNISPQSDSTYHYVVNDQILS